MLLQWPHQGARNFTKTFLFDPSTAESKFLSVARNADASDWTKKRERVRASKAKSDEKEDLIAMVCFVVVIASVVHAMNTTTKCARKRCCSPALRLELNSDERSLLLPLFDEILLFFVPKSQKNPLFRVLKPLFFPLSFSFCLSFFFGNLSLSAEKQNSKRMTSD